MTPAQPHLMSLYELVFIFAKRKWSLVAIVLTTVLCGLFWLFIIRDDAYEVSTKLLIKLGPEQALPTTLVGAPPAVVGYRNQEVNTEIDILSSRDLIAKVVDYLGMDQPSPPAPAPAGGLNRIRYEVKNLIHEIKDRVNELMIKAGLRLRVSPRDAAIDMLHQGLLVQAQRESNILLATLVFPQREAAATVLNTTVGYYLKYRLQLYENPKAGRFFQNEVGSVAHSLQDAEDELRGVEEKGGIQALDKQKEILLGEIAQLDRSVESERLGVEQAEEKVRHMEEEKRKPEPDFAALGGFERDSFAGNVLLQLAELQQDREKLLLLELDNSTKVQNNRKQFAELMRLLESNLRSVLNEKRTSLRRWENELSRVTKALQDLQSHQTQWQDGKRRVQLLEEEYAFKRKKLEEASVSDSLNTQEMGSVTVVERAIDPTRAAGTRKLTLLGIIFAAGLLTALAWLALAEFFDHGIYHKETLARHMGAPVLAVVSARRGFVFRVRFKPRQIPERPGLGLR